MKKLLAAFLLSFPILSQAAFLCVPVEWGGDGTSYTVGTTTSGTWYVWNCQVNGKFISQGMVIVAGHKPSLTCLSSIINPFISVTEKCFTVAPEEVPKFNRLKKSLDTARSKLPQ